MCSRLVAARGGLRVGTLLVAIALASALTAPPAAPQATDPHLELQWGLAQIHAADAWPLSTGAGVTIAIIDSGLDREHEDLADQIDGGVTFWECPSDERPCGSGDWEDNQPPSDSGGTTADPHGTHVAGIAAAVTGNGIGVAGTAPDARVLTVKALGRTDPNLPAGGTTEDVADAIRWAADNGADVINLSLGTGPDGRLREIVGEFAPIEDAIDHAIGRGAVLIAAAGNSVASLCGYPAADPAVVCVLATDRREAPATYSNRATPGELTVAAPGGAAFLTCRDDILSTFPAQADAPCGDLEGTPGYEFLAGTSMAAPHVAGVAALLVAQGRSADEVIDVLTSTARTPPTNARGQFTPAYGFGIVDAAAAVVEPVTSSVVQRVAGPERIGTAAAVSQRTRDTADVVVLARADVYADALAGAPLAIHLGGPLLTSQRDRLSQATADEIDRLGASEAVLLGGESALSAQVERDLADMGLEVRRVSGPDRFATAAAVAAELGATDEVFVAEGANADPARGWPDALSASGLAAAAGKPILLVTRDHLPPATADALSADVDVVIVGGRASVSDAVADAIDARAGEVRRLAGPSRYDTSVAVADEAEARGFDATVTWLATGRNFADGLVAGAAAGAVGGLLLLVDGQDLDNSPASLAFIEDRAEAFRSLYLTGGTAAISGEVEERLREIVGDA